MFSWTRQTLMSNLQTKIEPTEQYTSMCNSSVDLLVQHLYKIVNPTFKPREVVKSGSLGKGTAVKDKSDIDLVVYMRDDGIDGTIEEQRKKAIAFLKIHIVSHNQCSFDGETQAAVKVKLQVDLTHTVDVDILPSFLFYDNPPQIYDKMKDDRRFRETASAALAPLQRDFVKHRPAKVKQLIRLVKYWKGTCLQENPFKRLPTSYPLELITIGEWEDAGKPEDFDMRKGFYHVMNAIKNYRNIHRVWYINYDKSRITGAGVLHGHYVIDPANPYNNVMDRCDTWDDVSRQVGTFLRQELFSGISPSDGWQ